MRLTFRFLLFVGLVWAGVAGELRADGKVLPRQEVAGPVDMPDQRALLAWHEGVQTLVIETAFVGEGAEFAWVVPLPAKPEVEAASAGTLPAVAALMLPELRSAERGHWVLAGLAAGLALAIWFLGWSGLWRGVRALLVGCIGLFGGGLAGGVFGAEWIGAAVGLLLAWWLGRHWILRAGRPVTTFGLLLLVLFLAAVLIPTTGKVRSAAGTAPVAAGLEIERRVVGDFDVTLIAGREAGGVVRWLEENGFALGPEARAEAERQAEAGAWFVASRLRRDFAERGRSTPAPLVFRFEAERPLYPMRLTGAGARRPLELELFVFGPARAEVDGLRALAWGPLRRGDAAEQGAGWRSGQTPDSRLITHRRLLGLTEGTSTVTHLRGRLRPAGMSEDLVVVWVDEGPAARGLWAWSHAAALQIGVLSAAGLALLVALARAWLVGGTRARPRVASWVLAVCLAGGLVLAWCLPSVRVREGEPLMHGYERRQVFHVAESALGEMNPEEADEAMVREVFARELRRAADQMGWRIAVGDGPGEAELEPLPDGRWRLVLHDMAGQAWTLPGREVVVGWDYSPLRARLRRGAAAGTE